MSVRKALEKLLDYLASAGGCQDLSTGRLSRLAAAWQVPLDEALAARRYAESSLLIEPCRQTGAKIGGASFWLTGKGRTVLASLRVPEWQLPPSAEEEGEPVHTGSLPGEA